MSKYVPPFLKASSANETPAAQPAEPRRWGAALKPVVNTSIPAQQAPKLEPVTMSKATLNPEIAPLQPIRPRANTNITSMEDFPSLGGKSSKILPTIKPAMNFASMSRDWAQKQKEDEDKAKDEAAKEALWAQLQQQEREKNAKELADLKKAGIIAIPSLNSKKRDSDEELLEKKRYLTDDEDSSDPNIEDDGEDEEEEEEYGCDGVWDSRKHRDELY
jgi:hypothetical protein